MTQEAGRSRQLLIAVLLGALLWLGILSLPYAAGRAGISDAVEFRLLDLRHRLAGPVAPVGDVMLVAIDDATMAAEVAQGQSRRQLLAQTISRIAESGARALVLDVLLADVGTSEDDAALSSALSRLPAVIAGALRFEGQTVTKIWPREPFAAAAETGLVNLSTDAAGTPRYVPLLVTAGQETIASAALVAVLLSGDRKARFDAGQLILDDRVIALDDGMNMPLRYLGPAGSVPTMSALALFEQSNTLALSGKTVVLGFSATAMGDRFSTPFDDSMPGMEVIATAVSQLAGGMTLERDQTTRQMDVAHAVLLTALCLAILTIWPLSRGLPGVLLLLFLSFAFVTILFAQGYWYSAALPLFAAVPPTVVLGALRYRWERAQAAQSAQTVASLRRFQSSALIQRLEKDPDYLTEPEEQELVIFFADLTGFTGLSQKLGPTGTRQLLQVFHELCDNCIESRGGSVFNYMGDGVMAVFGMEEVPAGSVDDALDAAFDLIGRLSQTKLPDLPGMTLQCRIGIHLGAVTLSRLGGTRHQQLTVTGDTVNFASRLMEVAKSETVPLVASMALVSSMTGEAKIKPARQTDVVIRGRAGTEQVFVWSHEALETSPA